MSVFSNCVPRLTEWLFILQRAGEIATREVTSGIGPLPEDVGPMDIGLAPKLEAEQDQRC